ncbi:MAG: adenylate/guanylate cyclase domain-containing protein [Methylotenera sp.]|nr:adenylate/guanylate cyclase domain-containing protein [Oligoflexia bacterium]
MKTKLWLFQVPVVLIFYSAFYITQLGVNGDLKNEFVRNNIFSNLRIVSGMFTNFKFRIRGPQPPKNRIVIVEVDSESIAQHGRWPWHRDKMAELVQKSFDAGAKVVGLDIVFSEEDKRVSETLKEVLQKNNLAQVIPEQETDNNLETIIQFNPDKLVLGWTSENACQPAYMPPEGCPVKDPEKIASLPPHFDKFAYQSFIAPKDFDSQKTSLVSAPSVIANIPKFNDAATHSGYFNSFADEDGYVRRTNLVMLVNGKPYPSLPLEMMRVGLNDELKVEVDASYRISDISFTKSGRSIPVTPLGAMEINFRGPAYTFTYISAKDVLSFGTANDAGRNLASTSTTESLREALKDAYVLIGVSAIGVFDMRAFPFDSNTPGVEGHANILDNLLSGDMLTHKKSQGDGFIWISLLMVVGALLLAFITEKMESVPALLLFMASLGAFSVIDAKVLFQNNIHWDTSFLYLEMGVIFMFTIALKYVSEEKNKKFIRGALSKYVAPTIVDSILKDPRKLSLGGEKKDLTILFSDIRGFTSFSEKMDAKQLAGFLNDYLGIMTDIVFDCEGTLDKYIGDAVMAFWGAPLDQPKHATNACIAAMKMQKALADNRERFRTQYGIEVNIGIGVNTGSVNVGNMGSERIFEYTVIGDHVNLASRLEGLTKTYGAGIVTSRYTFDDIVASAQTLPPHRVLDFVKVKGKKNAVELIQVLDAELPAEALKLFDHGRELYKMQKWDEAAEAFEKVKILLGGHDGPSEMYLERCRDFKLTPPEANWDGSWEMHSK